MSSDQDRDGDFVLEFDPISGRAHLKACGLWSHATVDRWEKAIDAMVAQSGGRLRFLVDLRAQAVHSRDIAPRIQAKVAAVSPYFDRVAMLLPSSALFAMQNRRMLPQTGSNHERERVYGPDDAEAEAAKAWLAEPVTPRRSPFVGLSTR